MGRTTVVPPVPSDLLEVGYASIGKAPPGIIGISGGEREATNSYCRRWLYPLSPDYT
jgi:hypothetical protein